MEEKRTIWKNIRRSLQEVFFKFDTNHTNGRSAPIEKETYPNFITNKRSAYRLLEVNMDSSLMEINHSYWTLIKRYYPMVKNEDPHKADSAKKIVYALTEAFEILEKYKVD